MTQKTTGLAAATAVPDHLAQAALAAIERSAAADECDGTPPARTPADELVAGRRAVAAEQIPDGTIRVGAVQLGTRLVYNGAPGGYVTVVAVDDQPFHRTRDLWHEDSAGKRGQTGLLDIDSHLFLHTGPDAEPEASPEASPEALALADALDRVAGLLRSGDLPAGYIVKLTWHTRDLGDTHDARLAVIEQTATALGGTVDHRPVLADEYGPAQVHHHARATIGPLNVSAAYVQHAGEAGEVTA